MGVKPVEYKKDSSTAGFAVAGDQKTITQTNANTIQKDADQGNTEKLDRGQEGLLARYVDEDTLEYSAEETRKVGQQQINTTGKDGEDLSEKDNKANAGAAAGGAALGAGAGITGAVASMLTTYDKANKTADFANVPGGSVAVIVIAALCTAGSAIALTLSFPSLFDPAINDRKNQTSAAEQNNQTIQNYTDTMLANMDSMDADLAGYTAACEQKCANDIEASNSIAEIQAQIIEYRAQGNEEKVAELTAQLEKYKQEAEVLGADGEDSMNVYKENLENYRTYNEEALGVAESGTTVSDFLKDGKPLKNIANAAAYMAAIGALAALTCVAKPMKALRSKSNPWLAWEIPNLIASMTCFAVSAIMMGLASKNMFGNAKDEGAAGDAGNTMAEYVAKLNENTDAQAGYTEETTGAYSALDAAAAEEVGKTEEGNQEANQDLANNVKPTDEKPDPNQGDGGNA